MVVMQTWKVGIRMPYVPVPKDLATVKTKVAMNLTARQLVCFSAAASIGVPVYLLTKDTIGNTAAIIMMIALMLPAFFLAMYEKDGRPAERVLRDMLRMRIWSGVRPYKTENLYRYLHEEGGKLSEEKDESISRKRTRPKR